MGTCPFPAGLTVLNPIDLIYQPLVRQLRGQWGQQVHVAVQQQEGIKDGKYGILAPRELALHPDHHVGHVLEGNHITLVMVQATADGCDLWALQAHACKGRGWQEVQTG